MTENKSEIETLGARYPLEEVKVPIGDRAWRITAVRDQDALIAEVKTDADLQAFPYGLMLWASALGLSERLAAEPALIAGKRVLELGAGVGLPGIVAASLGASEVTQTDYQEDALALARHNATANGVQDRIRLRHGDWRAFFTDSLPFDIVIGSDLLYERSLHTPLADLLPRLIAPDGLILISDPLRPQALDFLERRIEKSRAWDIRFEGKAVRMPGETQKKDIALCWMRRK